MAGEPLDVTVRALPEGSRYRQESEALDMRTMSPVPLSDSTDRSPHYTEDEDDHPYTTVTGCGSREMASPTPSLRDVTGNVTLSPAVPAKFPSWFRDGDVPNVSLEDVTIRNDIIPPVKEGQTVAENADRVTSKSSPQVPQLEFEDFTENIMAGLEKLDPVVQQAVRDRMNIVFTRAQMTTLPSTPGEPSPVRSTFGHSAEEHGHRYTAAEKGKHCQVSTLHPILILQKVKSLH